MVAGSASMNYTFIVISVRKSFSLKYGLGNLSLENSQKNGKSILPLCMDVDLYITDV